MAVRSDDANDKDAKEPWKNLKLSGRVHSKFLFRTALARNIIPFGLVAPPLVVLPLQVQSVVSPEGQPLKRLKLLDHNHLQLQGQLETARWFKEVENIWNRNKTEKAANMNSLNRLDFQRGLTGQNLNQKFWVLYSASAKDANAFVYERGSLDLDFLVENTAYVFETNDEQESHFLTSFLNSAQANAAMKPFQAAGLFGERHVHRKILDVPLPQFRASNPVHVQLAELGKACAERVADYIAAENLTHQEYNVGQVRSYIRRHLLVEELQQIDEVLTKVIG